MSPEEYSFFLAYGVEDDQQLQMQENMDSVKGGLALSDGTCVQYPSAYAA